MNNQRRMFSWQVLTTSLLLSGYAGYYLCRSDLAVALPLIAAELTARGIHPDLARIRLGTIASAGVLAYALGKFVSGSLADFLGGRRNFLAGMGGIPDVTFGIDDHVMRLGGRARHVVFGDDGAGRAAGRARQGFELIGPAIVLVQVDGGEIVGLLAVLLPGCRTAPGRACAAA